MFNMKETKTPKGVWFSTMLMSAPLLSATGYLAMMAPIVQNAALVDPNTFAYAARTCVRLLSLNISFFGGIHYGLAAATYDTARSEAEQKSISIQMFYSFIPALLAFASSNFLLFSSPLNPNIITYAFSSLMVTQLVSLKFDHHCVSKEMAPLWFKKYRSYCFGLYMGITTLLYAIYISKVDYIQRKNDPNRIKDIKTVMELEDLDFVKMVDELNLNFDEVDLRDVEKKISSKMS